MTDYINNRRSPKCDYEQKLNTHLSVCKKKEPCEYKRVYSNVHYCQRAKRLLEAEQVFQRERQAKFKEADWGDIIDRNNPRGGDI